jgi:hypothetical protein
LRSTSRERFKRVKTSVTIEKVASGGAQNKHAHCFICGDQNPRSLGLEFQAVDVDTVCATFQASPELQGYDGILHGGVIAALLDAAMTHCLFHRGIQAMTGDLHVRFLHLAQAFWRCERGRWQKGLLSIG